MGVSSPPAGTGGRPRPVRGAAAAGRALAAAFDDWLAEMHARGRLAQASSQAVYRAMWQALQAWCVRQQPVVTLRSLDAATLARYLASREGMARHTTHQAEPLHPRYQWRLLSLVQRVQAHHAMRHRLEPQTAAAQLIAARPAVRRANTSLVDQLPAHLSPDEARRLVRWLAGTARPPADDAPPVRWQDVRNRCAAALQLGAGLGPGEVRALRLADVQWLASRNPPLPWRLAVPASGSAPAHEVPVRSWTARLLARWCAVRDEAQIAGDWLLPSTRTGKPWGKVAQFEAARQVLAEAGIDSAGGGSFRLRHTFALRQLQRGRAPDEVARWLGIADPAVMARYQRVLAPRPAEVA